MLVRGSYSSNPLLLIIVAVALLVVAIHYLGLLFHVPSDPRAYQTQHGSPGQAHFDHPIDDLVYVAGETFQELLTKDVSFKDVKNAAHVYREKRGRHPPPDFDKWFEFARNKNSLVIEEFFDQIYHDLEPFWAINPAKMRSDALNWPFLLNIRSGKVRARNARLVAGEWVQYWERLLKEMIDLLPDVDIAVNQLDESRLVVPWEDMNAYIQASQKTKSIKKPSSKSQVVSEWPKLEDISFSPDQIPLTGLKPVKGIWQDKSTKPWRIMRKACHPNSEARDAHLEDPSTAPSFHWETKGDFPPGSYLGYVSNTTQIKDVCQRPDLRNMIGTFVSPRFNSVNKTLIPLFSGCKIAGVNNEILLPAAKYLSEEAEFGGFGGQTTYWEDMKDAVIWRGQATGGAHKKNNWKRFHRQRFVALTNSTYVQREDRIHSMPSTDRQPLDDFEKDHPQPGNIPFPSLAYNLSAHKTSFGSTLGSWIANKSDTGFYHLMCDPWDWTILAEGKSCEYMNPYYHAVDRIDPASQWSYKYLPDIDGNSYSGRYRAFLASNSLPIKATIWSEWHDSRLIAWKHFVPMDNSYVDFWPIMEYFLGYGNGAVNSIDGDADTVASHADDMRDPGEFKRLSKSNHDDVAKKIAEDGREWAKKVLRKEDMLVYVYRLILEYKRVSSDERLRMNWVDDLF